LFDSERYASPAGQELRSFKQAPKVREKKRKDPELF
jgi:hypothetical protein